MCGRRQGKELSSGIGAPVIESKQAQSFDTARGFGMVSHQGGADTRSSAHDGNIAHDGR